MPPAYTLDEVAALLNTVVAGIRTGDNGDDRVYSLDEVAERTGFALSQLELDCRNGTVEHTRRGRAVGLTSRQIAILVTRHRAGGDLAEDQRAAGDELAEVRRATLAGGARRTRRRPA